MSADRPIPLTGGHFAVPGNRWDLLQENAFDAATVGVVIPYYEQPAQLALVLRALELQTYPHDLMHVVIADDAGRQRLVASRRRGEPRGSRIPCRGRAQPRSRGH